MISTKIAIDRTISNKYLKRWYEITMNNNEESLWSFSIVYSPVWSIPVLYFQVQNSDGSILSRNEVLTIIIGQSFGDGHEDSWNFISQEEHPVTGFPTYFLHPCQTSVRLSMLLGIESAKVAESIRHPGIILISWLCMVLPATGFRIDPHFYSSIREEMLHPSNLS